MFISFLYMFRATMCPSSGEITVFMRHLVFVILYGWLSGRQGRTILHNGHSSIQNNKYQASHKYSCFSWWWAHSRPKHVEKRDKHTKKKLCTKLALFTRLYKDARSTKHKIKHSTTKIRVPKNISFLRELLDKASEYYRGKELCCLPSFVRKTKNFF